MQLHTLTLLLIAMACAPGWVHGSAKKDGSPSGGRRGSDQSSSSSRQPSSTPPQPSSLSSQTPSTPPRSPVITTTTSPLRGSSGELEEKKKEKPEKSVKSRRPIARESSSDDVFSSKAPFGSRHIPTGYPMMFNSEDGTPETPYMHLMRKQPWKSPKWRLDPEMPLVEDMSWNQFKFLLWVISEVPEEAMFQAVKHWARTEMPPKDKDEYYGGGYRGGYDKRGREFDSQEMVRLAEQTGVPSNFMETAPRRSSSKREGKEKKAPRERKLEGTPPSTPPRERKRESSIDLRSSGGMTNSEIHLMGQLNSEDQMNIQLMGSITGMRQAFYEFLERHGGRAAVERIVYPPEPSFVEIPRTPERDGPDPGETEEEFEARKAAAAYTEKCRREMTPEQIEMRLERCYQLTEKNALAWLKFGRIEFLQAKKEKNQEVVQKIINDEATVNCFNFWYGLLNNLHTGFSSESFRPRDAHKIGQPKQGTSTELRAPSSPRVTETITISPASSSSSQMTSSSRDAEIKRPSGPPGKRGDGRRGSDERKKKR